MIWIFGLAAAAASIWADSAAAAVDSSPNVAQAVATTPATLLVPALLALLAYFVTSVMPAAGRRATPAAAMPTVAARPFVRQDGSLRMALVLGWAAQALAIVVDTSGAAWAPPTGPHFGFAAALSATSWLVIGVYLVESRTLPLGGVRRLLAALGALSVALMLVYPGEVIPPAVARWAPLHWVLGIASYGLFGAAVLHAALLDRADRRMRMRTSHTPSAAAANVPLASADVQGDLDGGFAPTARLPLLQLERLTFRFVVAGFAALTVTLLLGWFLASPWRWEQKTVFSLWAWVVFAALLAGRSAFGWRGRQATRWLYVGAGLLLIAYVGSRFVIEVVLHRPLTA